MPDAPDTPRLPIPDWTTLRNHPERLMGTTAVALARGYPLGRKMTKLERRVIAVVSAHPTHTMTLTSSASPRDEMAAKFRLVVKRLNRWLERRTPRNPKRLIYVATLASAKGSSRYHVHALLWTYVHAAKLHGFCRDVGLGKPHLRKLPAESVGDIHYWTQVTYVLAQNEPAFGVRKDRENELRPAFGHRLMHPQKQTLRRDCPQLLSALEDADDPVITDDELLQRLPNFS